MINKSFESELQQINNQWKSKSRIYGEVIELWIENNLPCSCHGIFITQPANQKSIDSTCNKCSKNIQIKSSSKPFKINRNNELKILGAEFTTTLNSVNSNLNWDLMLVYYNKDENFVEEIKLVKSKDISYKNVIPRKPLGQNARRAGWQGCYLVFSADVVEDLLS